MSRNLIPIHPEYSPKVSMSPLHHEIRDTVVDMPEPTPLSKSRARQSINASTLSLTNSMTSDASMNPEGFFYQVFKFNTGAAEDEANAAGLSFVDQSMGLDRSTPLRSRFKNRGNFGSRQAQIFGSQNMIMESEISGEDVSRLVTYNRDENRTNVDPTEIDPLLYHISQCHFQLSVFVFEFVAHFLMPLLLLFCWHPFLKLVCINRGFVFPTNSSWFVNQWGYYLGTVSLNVIFFVWSPPNVTLTEVFVANVFSIVRFMIIASKYAYTSPAEYKQILSERVSVESSNRRQVITGWIQVKPSLRDMQLTLASTRKQISLTTAYFDLGVKIPKQLKNDEDEKKPNKIAVSAFLPLESDLKFADSSKSKLFVWDVATMLLTETATFKVSSSITWINIFIHCLIPLMACLFDHAASGVPLTGFTDREWALTISFYIINTLVASFVVFVSWVFIAIGLLDFRRRVYIQRRLNAILHDGFILVPDKEIDEPELDITNDNMDPKKVLKNAKVLRLDMNNEINLMSWWYLKLCLQDWGLPYYSRIITYTGFFMLLPISLVILLVIFIFILNVNPGLHLVLYTCYLGTLMSYAILIMVFYGAWHNQQKHEASRLLSRKKTEFLDQQLAIERDIAGVEEALVSNSKSPKLLCLLQDLKKVNQKQKDLLRTLQVVQDAVDRDLEDKIRILGFEAGPPLMQTIIYVIGVVLTITAKKFLGI